MKISPRTLETTPWVVIKHLPTPKVVPL